LSHRCRALARTALLAALATAVLAAPAAAKPPRAPFYGVSPQAGTATPKDFRLMDRADVGTFRLFFRWPQVQKTRGGAYNWVHTDAEVENAASHGLTILGGLTGTPDWIRCPLSTTSCRLRPAIHTQAARTQWLAFVRAAAERYGPDGSFWTANPLLPKSPITTWQVWNEQNSVGRYKPQPSPSEYALLIKITHRALNHATGGQAKVLLGGMFGTPPRPASIDSWDFLRRLYGIQGAKRSFDGVAVHPYSPNLRGIRYQISHLRQVMSSHHDGSTGLWVTELGWGSARTPHDLTKGRHGQAKMLRDSFTMLLRNRFKWHLRGVYWYSWRDYPSGQGCPQWCTSSGLLQNDYDVKPAFRAYRDFASKAR
jgi:hypothetical protein